MRPLKEKIEGWSLKRIRYVDMTEGETLNKNILKIINMEDQIWYEVRHKVVNSIKNELRIKY